MDPKEIMIKMIEENKYCVLATSTKEGKPEAATIEYSHDRNYNIIFETFQAYRKYNNLINNPKASIVITEGSNTVQMDGIVQKLEGKVLEEAKEIHFHKFGKNRDLYKSNDNIFFIFIPKWKRIMLGENPPKFIEIKD